MLAAAENDHADAFERELLDLDDEGDLAGYVPEPELPFEAVLFDALQTHRGLLLQRLLEEGGDARPAFLYVPDGDELELHMTPELTGHTVAPMEKPKSPARFTPRR